MLITLINVDDRRMTINQLPAFMPQSYRTFFFKQQPHRKVNEPFYAILRKGEKKGEDKGVVFITYYLKWQIS